MKDRAVYESKDYDLESNTFDYFKDSTRGILLTYYCRKEKWSDDKTLYDKKNFLIETALDHIEDANKSTTRSRGEIILILMVLKRINEFYSAQLNGKPGRLQEVVDAQLAKLSRLYGSAAMIKVEAEYKTRVKSVILDELLWKRKREIEIEETIKKSIFQAKNKTSVEDVKTSSLNIVLDYLLERKERKDYIIEIAKTLALALNKAESDEAVRDQLREFKKTIEKRVTEGKSKGNLYRSITIHLDKLGKEDKQESPIEVELQEHQRSSPSSRT